MTTEDILNIIAKTKESVFEVTDFEQLGDDELIRLLLIDLCNAGEIIEVADGIYMKSRLNELTGQKMIDSEGGMDGALVAILNKMGIDYEYTGLTLAYMRGQTTQIPARIQIKLKRPLAKQLCSLFDSYNLHFTA